jgi:hypothetical protein
MVLRHSACHQTRRSLYDQPALAAISPPVGRLACAAPSSALLGRSLWLQLPLLAQQRFAFLLPKRRIAAPAANLVSGAKKTFDRTK